MSGIHHVTAIAGDPARNFEFYTRTLGLRFVKKTVNFDDPGTYHLYFGDETGSPGSILTFFPWTHASRGRGGVGLTEETAFRVPQSGIGYWAHRFVEKGVEHSALEKRFGETVLSFVDPDGLKLSLVGVEGAEKEPAWTNGDVPAEHALRGFHGVKLMLDSTGPTGDVLTKVLGFTKAGKEGTVTRFVAKDATYGGVVDIQEAKDFLPGRMGRGSVHHIAFRAADDEAQAEMRRLLIEEQHIQATEQMNRNYFRSIYFREPGGIIFEIATDVPGFAVDEPVAELGRSLKLPEFLESRRKQIEASLVPLETAA
jgi:glyoxalase family protein